MKGPPAVHSLFATNVCQLRSDLGTTEIRGGLPRSGIQCILARIAVISMVCRIDMLKQNKENIIISARASRCVCPGTHGVSPRNGPI